MAAQIRAAPTHDLASRARCELAPKRGAGQSGNLPSAAAASANAR
jgi:hypothetical protein